jgi:hypothetical protein
MLSIKYACSMKKMMMIKKLKIKRNKLIVINNRRKYFRTRKKIKGEKVKKIRKKIRKKKKDKK